MMTCYISERMYGHVLVLPSRRLVCPVVDDDFASFFAHGSFVKVVQLLKSFPMM